MINIIYQYIMYTEINLMRPTQFEYAKRIQYIVISQLNKTRNVQTPKYSYTGRFIVCDIAS